MLGVWIEFFAERPPPDQDEGSERLAIVGLLGIGLYVLAVIIDELTEWVRRRFHTPPRGFEPIINDGSEPHDQPPSR